MLDILRYICPHSGIFWQIQGYSESWHSQTCLYILRHIQNPWLIQPYSEPLTYLDSFRHYSRAIHTYSEPYQSGFRHIQNSGQFRHFVLAYSQSYRYRGIFATLGFRHIQDPGITGSSNVKEHLLFKSGSSFKSFGTFSYFCFKINIQIFFSGQCFNNNNKNNKQHGTHASTPPTPPTLLTLARHPRQHATHASTPPTQARHPCHPRQHVTHANAPPAPHTLARYPRKHATYATHASMLATPPTLARHLRKHATHASTNSTPFLKLSDDLGTVQNQPITCRKAYPETFLMLTINNKNLFINGV